MANPTWRRSTARAGWLAFGLLLGAVASHGCATGGAYACTSDAACTAGGSEGVCQDTGYLQLPVRRVRLRAALRCTRAFWLGRLVRVGLGRW